VGKRAKPAPALLAFSSGFAAGEALGKAQFGFQTVAVRLRASPGIGKLWSKDAGFPDWSELRTALTGDFSRDRLAAGMLASADVRYTNGGEPLKSEAAESAIWNSSAGKAYRSDLKLVGCRTIAEWYALSGSARAAITKKGGKAKDANQALSRRVGTFLSNTWDHLRSADDLLNGRRKPEREPQTDKPIADRVAAVKVEKIGELMVKLKDEGLTIPEWLKEVRDALIKGKVIKAESAGIADHLKDIKL
jgi:hypothetical protein